MKGWVEWPWIVAAVLLVGIFCWAVIKIGKGWEEADGMQELRGISPERDEDDEQREP